MLDQANPYTRVFISKLITQILGEGRDLCEGAQECPELRNSSEKEPRERHDEEGSHVTDKTDCGH